LKKEEEGEGKRTEEYDASDEGCHRFVRGACLHLEVGRLVVLAFVAHKHSAGCSTSLSILTTSYRKSDNEEGQKKVEKEEKERKERKGRRTFKGGLLHLGPLFADMRIRQLLNNNIISIRNEKTGKERKKKNKER